MIRRWASPTVCVADPPTTDHLRLGVNLKDQPAPCPSRILYRLPAPHREESSN